MFALCVMVMMFDGILFYLFSLCG